MDDPTDHLMRWFLGLSSFDFTSTHRPGRKHQVPDAVFRLSRNNNFDSPTEDDEIPTFKSSSVLPLHIQSASDTSNTTVHDIIATAAVDYEKDLEDTSDDEDMELDVIDMYKPNASDVYIDNYHCNALEEDECDLPFCRAIWFIVEPNC